MKRILLCALLIFVSQFLFADNFWVITNGNCNHAVEIEITKFMKQKGSGFLVEESAPYFEDSFYVSGEPGTWRWLGPEAYSVNDNAQIVVRVIPFLHKNHSSLDSSLTVIQLSIQESLDSNQHNYQFRVEGQGEHEITVNVLNVKK